MRASRLLLVLPLLLAGPDVSTCPTSSRTPPPSAPAGTGSDVSGDFSDTAPFTVTVDPAALTASIEALEVAEERDSGYDRSLFPHWKDDDGNGCDARDDVLVKQDRSGNLTEADCDAAMTGEWVSMYDGTTVADSGDIDIDHFVPLKEAWGSGAVDWTTEDRQAFAHLSRRTTGTSSPSPLPPTAPSPTRTRRSGCPRTRPCGAPTSGPGSK